MARWIRTTKSRDKSAGPARPLARPLACLLAPLTHLLRSTRCAHSFARSLTHSQAVRNVND